MEKAQNVRSAVGFEQVKTELDQLFKNVDNNIVITDLKSALLQNANYEQIVLSLQDELPGAKFRLIKGVLESQKMKEWKNKLGKMRQVQKQKQMLIALFNIPDLKHDISQLLDALLKKSSIEVEQILSKYQDILSGRDIRSIKKIINSDELKEFLQQKQEEKGNKNIMNPDKKELMEKQLKEIFITIKGNTDKLQKLLIEQNKNEIDIEMLKLEDEMPGRQFKALKNLLNSEELKKFYKKYSSDSGKNKQKLMRFFQKVHFDISDLIEALIQGRQIIHILSNYEQNLTGKQYKQIKAILDSNEFIRFFPSLKHKTEKNLLLGSQSIEAKKHDIEIKVNESSAVDYIIQKLKSKDLWQFEQKADEQSFVKNLTKSPHLFDIIIQKSLGKSGIFKRFINEMNQDKILKHLIVQSKRYPLQQIYTSISKFSRGDCILFNLEVEIQCWEMNPILKETSKLFKNFVLNTIKEEKNLEDILIKISELIFDILIRKGDLSMKINQINKIGAQVNHQLLQQITVYDFISLFSKIVEKSKLPYYGFLLHRNYLPIPIINCTLDKGVRRYYSTFQLLQNILIDKKFKLVCNVGTELSQKKGKTQLITKIFGIEYKNCSLLQCDFHQGCISFYTNLSSMTAEQPIIVADFHGGIFENLQQPKIIKIFNNASLIILHIVKKEEPELEDIIRNLKKETQARFFITVRDDQNHQSISVQKQKQFIKINLPKITQKLQAKKQYIQNQFRTSLISQIRKCELFLDYKNLVEQKQKNNLIKQEKLQNNILKRLDQSQKRGQLWSNCFPNLSQFREIYKEEQRMYELERLIRYDKQDERHQQYISIKQKYEEKNKISDLKEHYLTSVSEIYFENFNEINVKSLNSKISEWKRVFTENLEKQIVEMRAKYQKKQGDPKQILKIIQQKQNYLQQFDISADTLIQEILIVANNDKKCISTYHECLKNYYNQLYKTLNPINLIDGNTLLFGNPFLKDFFEQISKQMPKDKKVFVVSVIGIQSSAKSTLMNYLFNCRFETSAGRCTKGAYFTISQTEKQVFIVIDTEGLMSVCARDRVFDIQIASFTLLVSDLIIINNKGQINTPIRELLGVCTYALQQLNKRKPGKQRSKVFFAIRDQQNVGVQKQKSILSNIINSLKSHSDLADFQDFLDFNSESIYPLQSSFNKIPTNMDTTVQKSNYCFSESIIAMRSKIINFVNSKQPLFTSVNDFYQESQKKWNSIRECGEHIFNFQEVLQIRIKQSLKSIQQQLLLNEFKRIEELVSQSIDQIQKINNNDQLRKYKQAINDKIKKCQFFVRQKMNEKGQIIRGVKAQWIKELILESKNQFNQKVFIHEEFIENLYKEKIKKNKDKNFSEKISEIISSIMKTDRDLESIKIQYDQQCSKLLEEEEFKYDDQAVNLKAIIAKQVLQLTNIQISERTISKVNEQRFYEYFGTYIKVLQIPSPVERISSDEKRKAVQLIQKNQQKLKQQAKFLNNKYEPIFGQDTKKFIQDYELKVNEKIEQVYQEISKLTKEWKFLQLHLDQNKFKSYAFSTFCQTVSKLIEQNRKNRKIRANQQKNSLITKKWKQIQEKFSIKGNAQKVAEKIIKQFEQAIIKDLYQNSKKLLLNNLVILLNKFNPVQMIQETMRLTFRSTQKGKPTWMKCFKVIYDFNRFMQEQILYQQPEYGQLTKNIDIQKTNSKNQVPLKLQKVLSQLLKVKDFQQLGKLLDISVDGFQNLENTQIFENILHRIRAQLSGNKLQAVKQKIYNKIQDKKGIFNQLKKQMDTYIQDNLAPKIIGCQSRCPTCSMKCKQIRNHEGGHACVKQTHLQQCFSGMNTYKTHERTISMCFTEEQVFSGTYIMNQQSFPTLQLIKKYYPQWSEHFQSGPYQDRLNELNCQRIWANIGDVLIKTKYKQREIKNVGVKNEHKYNPLTESDVKNWIENTK